MVAYSFQRRFVEPIRWGLGLGLDLSDEVLAIGEPKLQTIRAVGLRRHARPGETLQLYFGMRTKQCKLIGLGQCVSVSEIYIDPPDGRIAVAGKDVVDLDAFAKTDGFPDWKQMQAFWLDRHGADDFMGVLIKWRPK